jgi:hypothetical protein
VDFLLRSKPVYDIEAVLLLPVVLIRVVGSLADQVVQTGGDQRSRGCALGRPTYGRRRP